MGAGHRLSIARSIMEQIGGTLMLISPASGRQDSFEGMLNFPELA